MKLSIEKQEEILQNMVGEKVKARKRFERASAEFNKLAQDVDKLYYQIQRAKREGKDGFDAERYQPKE
jgi:hypothetical protein